MFKQLNTNEMVHTLMQDEYADWSYEGATALIDYLEQFEEETGTPIAFDPVALRCEFSEYSSWDELRGEYDLDDSEIDEYVLTEFETAEGDTGIILQQF